MSSLHRAQKADRAHIDRTLKEDLRLSIIARREAKGQKQIKVEFKSPEKIELSPEELMKKERRREQNRRAAQRCRTKKRLTQCNVLHSFEQIIAMNKELSDELEQVKRERQGLQLLIDTQRFRCPCGRIFTFKGAPRTDSRGAENSNPLVTCHQQQVSLLPVTPVKNGSRLIADDQAPFVSRDCALLSSVENHCDWSLDSLCSRQDDPQCCMFAEDNFLQSLTAGHIPDIIVQPCMSLSSGCTGAGKPPMTPHGGGSLARGAHEVSSEHPYLCATRRRVPSSGASLSASDTASVSDACDARHSSLSSEDFHRSSVSSDGSLYSDHHVFNLLSEPHAPLDLQDVDGDDVFHAPPLDINNNSLHQGDRYPPLPVEGSAAPGGTEMATDDDVGAVFVGSLLGDDVIRAQGMSCEEMTNQILLDDVTSLLAISQDELVPLQEDPELLQVYS
ncbi:hypothetical protein Btru_046579 [Bulinus truncatus]|nr:hypothetical protein Btru_046579 [Bulinus truncatus]